MAHVRAVSLQAIRIGLLSDGRAVIEMTHPDGNSAFVVPFELLSEIRDMIDEAIAAARPN